MGYCGYIPRKFSRRLPLRALIFSTCASITSFGSAALAEVVRWSGDIEIAQLTCSASGIEKIIIEGTVTLLHPEDRDPYGARKTIAVLCGDMEFMRGSELLTISDLDIRLSGQLSGSVVIRSTRGVKGDDAPPTPEIWKQRKARDGQGYVGPGGGNGRDGASCAKIGGHGSDPGEKGQRGEDGADGEDGVTGAHGRAGARGSDITLLFGSIDPESTIEIYARGGGGGDGGRGGRGEDGGNAHAGGRGGNAGSSRGCHSADRGGEGGDGGDGGDGGNGGPGGNGGDGGDGGNILIGLKDGGGNPTVIPIMKNDGGLGGDPGAGGEKGLKGLKGGPGWGGNGGDGGIFHSDGPSGLSGGWGKDGVDGVDGPDGFPGEDGEAGRQNDGTWGTIPEDRFKLLVPGTS